MAALDPELDVAAKALAGEGAAFVVIGGFAVIANRFVRATEDIDLLIPEDSENDLRVISGLGSLNGVRLRDQARLGPEHLTGVPHLRASTDAGIIDIVRGGLPPLDYQTVAERALKADYGEAEILVASLRSIVGFKRLANRPQDRHDLERLAEIHGDLPVDPIPGIDD